MPIMTRSALAGFTVFAAIGVLLLPGSYLVPSVSAAEPRLQDNPIPMSE